MKSQIFLMILLNVLCVCESHVKTAFSEYTNLRVLNTENLDNFDSFPHVTAVYYNTKDISQQANLFEEYNAAAKYLEPYDIYIAVFDCLEYPETPDCKKEDVERSVYTYQHGVQIMALESETLFDVDSIMANLLQVALLEEVPIIQSRLERYDLEKSLVGKKNIVFSYPSYLGTTEHRKFLEIAYALVDVYQFALTTDSQAIVGLDRSNKITENPGFAMWALLCKETSLEQLAKNGVSYNSMYRGDAEFKSMAAFVSDLTEKTFFTYPPDSIDSILDGTETRNTLFIFTDGSSTPESDTLIHKLKYAVKGFNIYAAVFNAEACMKNEGCLEEVETLGVTCKAPCVGLKITGYTDFMPEMLTFNYDSIITFLENELLNYEKDSDETVLSSDEILIDMVETQDDEVAASVFKLQKVPMDLEHVPVYYKSNFYEMIKTAELKFVLFYLKFDSFSMAFLRDYGHASRSLVVNYSESKVLARVECFDATDLCAAENVTSYPVLRVYQQHGETRDYKGPLDAKSVVAAVKLLQLSTDIDLPTAEEAEMFINGFYKSNFTELTPVSVLLSSNIDKDTYHKIFNKFWNSVAISRVSEDLMNKLASKYSVEAPLILVVNRDDKITPVYYLHDLLEHNDLIRWIERATVPKFPELTVTNLPILYKMKKPFVILFVDPEQESSKSALATHASLAGILSQNLVICWMNAQAKSLGLKILSEYTWTATLPMITLVDHKQGKVYNYQKEISEEQVLNWLNRVKESHVPPSKNLSHSEWGAPGKAYDFLKKIEEEEMRKTRKSNENLETFSEDLSQKYSKDVDTLEEKFNPKTSSGDIEDPSKAYKVNRHTEL